MIIAMIDWDDVKQLHQVDVSISESTKASVEFDEAAKDQVNSILNKADALDEAETT